MSDSAQERRESAQMMVLGSDDRNDFIPETNVPQTPNSPRSWKRRKHRKDPPTKQAELHPPSLMSRIFGSSTESPSEQSGDGADELAYAALESGARSPPSTQQSAASADISPPQEALQPMKESLIDGGNGQSRVRKHRHSMPSEEDVLQQDCSFFYRGMEDAAAVNRSDRPRFSSLLRQAVSPMDNPSTNMMYSFMSSPPLLQKYRNRYDELNQTIPPDDDMATEERHDLNLRDEEACIDPYESEANDNNITGISRNNTAEYSSLFYVRHGKMLMKLPQDHIRLAMEPDLEPGILSVEQRRHQPEKSTEEPDNAGEDSQQQPLHYVLTVPDDLYRQVVADLSNGVFRPYWGMTASHDHKVDIKVAIFILVIVMFVMWVNVMVWPHQ